ncbi:AAA family ATPase [Gordonia sp. w5E2]|uniref:helix-turn-helix transcriptional regulator n=1 Tax=Gordonia TaxID=2053 RepID=UPI0009CF30D7|nr:MULTISPECIES: LuxR family transcriptional regulator [Gordonia]SKX75308.1 transcriptional regulator, luxR family [Mycobacteroides abscessus subsp. abscessus]
MSAECVAERSGDDAQPDDAQSDEAQPDEAQPSGHVRRGALLGREREQREIGGVIDSVIAGHSGVVLVRGEPGVGKTALVTAAADGAGRAGAAVLLGRAVAFEQSLRNALLQVLLLHLVDGSTTVASQHVSTLRLALGLEAGEMPTSPALADAVVSLVAEISTRAPVVIVVDDLQHADQSSKEVLDALVMARLPRVAVVATAPAHTQCGLGSCTVIDVVPLVGDAASKLLSLAHPNMALEVQRRILALAEGNPLALRALPAELRHDHLDGSASLPPVLPMSTVLRDRLFPDMPELPGVTRRLLLMHALAPDIPVNDLLAALGSRTYSEVVTPALDAGVVEISVFDGEATPADSPRIRFTRALFGSALMSTATDDERSATYRSLARVTYISAGIESDFFESDLSTGRTRFDDALATRLEVATEADLCTGEWRSGLDRLQRAVELTGDRGERHRRLARATQVAARVDREVAAQMFVGMQTGQRHFENSITDALAASAVIVIDDDGDVDTAYRMLMDAFERTAPHDADDPVVVEAVEALRELCWLGGRAELWDGYRRVVDEVAPEASSALGLMAALWRGPSTLSAVQRTTLDALIAGLSVDHSPLWIGEIAEMAATFDRIDECRAVLDELIDGIDTCRDVTSRPSIAAVWAMLLLAQDAFHRGKWSTTTELARQAKAVCGVDGHDHLGWLADYLLGMVAAVRGEVDLVEQLAARMRAWAIPRRAFVLIRFAEHLWTLVAGGRGDVGSVYIHATAVSPVGRLGPYVSMSGMIALDLVRSATRTGRDDDARAHVAAIEEAQIGRISSRLNLIALACRAMISGDDSGRLFEEALALPGADQWVFEYARIQYTYGMELRRNQELVAARRQLRAALSTFVELGATPWATRAEAELDATAPTRNVVAADSELTAYELRIAEMAAAGLTNKTVAERLDISHRTVGNHLYRIYAKLGVTSRVELRDVLAVSKPRTGSPAGRLVR